MLKFSARNIYLILFAILTTASISWLQTEQGGPKLDEANTIAITKASFLFQFAKSNDWPNDKKQGNFRIGIQGNTALYNFLVEKYSGQTIGSQLLEIVEIFDITSLSETTPNQANNKFIHVLYIESEGDMLTQIIEITKDKPIMVVTSVSGETAMPEGAVVNFIVQTSRIRYELDMENALKRGLIVGNRILSWAITR
jgi:hypothetical protein